MLLTFRSRWRGHAGLSTVKATGVVRVLDHITSKEMLGELGLFSFKIKRLGRGITPV